MALLTYCGVSIKRPVDPGPETSQVDNVDSACHRCWRACSVASNIERFPAISEVVIIDVEWQLNKSA
jgi:hypothetical protein